MMVKIALKLIMVSCPVVLMGQSPVFYTVTEKSPIISQSVETSLNDTVILQEAVPEPVSHPPLKGPLLVTSAYGWRKNPFKKDKKEFHRGIDLSGREGDLVYAMLAGTVEAVGYDYRSGNYIKLRHGNFTIAYCHLLRKPPYKKGTPVYPGMPIGQVSHTGRATGSHLHITVKLHGMPINPNILFQYLGLLPAQES